VHAVQAERTHPQQTPLLPRKLPVQVMCVLVVGVALATVGARAAQTSARNDFTQDYVAARAFLYGLDPYENTKALADKFLGSNADLYDDAATQRNPHPPAHVLLVVPLAALPYPAAIVLWRILIIICIATSIYLLCRALSVGKGESAVIGAASLIIPSAQSELLYGNATAIVLLLLAISFKRFTHSADRASGLSGGVATALKAFPGLLVVAFLKARKTRAAAWLIGAAVVITALSVGAMRLDRHARIPLGDPNFAQFKTSPWNLSLPSMAFRIASGTPAVILAICIAIACLAIALKSKGNLSGPFWHIVPWMILISPLSWYALLMIPVVIAAMIQLSGQKRLRLWHPLLFAAASFGTVVPIASGPNGTRETILGLVPTIAILAFALLDAVPTNKQDLPSSASRATDRSSS
jgi:hypothetical protein